ncbi:MAG: hypothetical protein LBD03_01900 [Methanobrevibacter sp.]|nr:hypothetical protein [Candidatus Methanovirga procula]
MYSSKTLPLPLTKVLLNSPISDNLSAALALILATLAAFSSALTVSISAAKALMRTSYSGEFLLT